MKDWGAVLHIHIKMYRSAHEKPITHCCFFVTTAEQRHAMLKGTNSSSKRFPLVGGKKHDTYTFNCCQIHEISAGPKGVKTDFNILI